MKNISKAKIKPKMEKVFVCTECGFHYVNKEWAEKCEAWCKKYHSCNIEITSHAKENIIKSKNILIKDFNKS